MAGYYKILSLIFCFFVSAACISAKDNTVYLQKKLNHRISKMTLHEKIGQMFVISPESLNQDSEIKYVTEFSNEMAAYYKQYPAGGFIIFSENIEDEKQLKKLNKKLHSIGKNRPLIFVDEEGGRVARLAKTEALCLHNVGSMSVIGNSEDTKAAFAAGKYIGSYLKDFGFDVDFAPVADINSNSMNTVIGDRAFSADPEIVAKMSVAFMEGLKKSGVAGCFKHFPGHGDTMTDTHSGYAETVKTWNELLNCEMIPFAAGIENNVPFIMTAHVAVPSVTGCRLPATVSGELLTEKLRNELHFEGIIITDAMNMGAISKHFSQSEAAVQAILAGADIILLPSDYVNAFEGIENAVKNGIIPEEKINESVLRILTFKALKK